MIKAIIIDDEQKCIDTLSELLTAHFNNEIEILGSFQSVEDGEEGIKKLCPDLVFLDVEIKNKTGFDLLARFKNIDFNVIFVTAYDKYAVQAFEVSAFDYLLKAVSLEKLQQSIRKLNDKISKENTNKRLEIFFDYLKGEQVKIKSIVIHTANGYNVVQVAEIVRCTAGKGSTTEIVMKTGEKITVAKNLQKFEDMLEEYKFFFRVHRSNLINLTYVKKYKDGTITMSDNNNTKIALSSEKESEFRSRLNAL